MKKKGELTIKINLSNRWIYFLITLGILVVISVGVYAISSSGPNSGHPASDLDFTGGFTVPSGKITAPEICIGSSCKTSWPSTGTEVCPSGMTIIYTYINDGEDITGTHSTERLLSNINPQDGCDGDNQVSYTCPVDASKICRDVFRFVEDGIVKYRYRQITCKRTANVKCKE